MPSESDSIRARRLEIAAEEALSQKLGPNHLIGVQGAPTFITEPEPEKAVNPTEDSCYDALVYLREGMSRQEVIDAVLMRNRITKADAEKIVDQVIELNRKESNADDSHEISRN